MLGYQASDMNPVFKRLLIVASFISFASQHAFPQAINEASEPRFDGQDAIDLLEGNNLDAWEIPSERWSMEGDCVVGETGEGKITTPEWLYTKESFADFSFTCELRLSGDQRRNTGIYYRATKIRYGKGEGFEAASGYEFDAAFHDGSSKRNFRGTLGDWYSRPKLRVFPDPMIINEAFKTDEWNRLTLRARGNRLEYWINGIKIMDYIDTDPNGRREGVIGFQIHDGSVMKVEYRKIRVQPLGGGGEEG